MTQFTDNPEQYTSQQIDNESFNDAYKIREEGSYGYDSVTDSFKPMNADIAYDYVGYTNSGSTVDTYKFYTGGSGGTLVKTLTITYTDSTKTQISSLARS